MNPAPPVTRTVESMRSVISYPYCNPREKASCSERARTTPLEGSAHDAPRGGSSRERSLEVSEVLELFGDLFEFGFGEAVGLLVLDDDAAEEEADEVRGAGEAGAFDGFVDAVGEVLRDGDGGVVGHGGGWWGFCVRGRWGLHASVMLVRNRFFGVRWIVVDMGMRPPADDGEREPATVAFGIAAVDNRLGSFDVSYPASKRELRESVGHVEVPYDTRGHSVLVGGGDCGGRCRGVQ